MLIFCSGMLRSGSAFQYNLVSSLLEKFGPTVRHGRWEPKSRFSNEDMVIWAKDPTIWHVVKSARYPEEFQLARAGLAKICYIYRDLRDVAVASKYKFGLEGEALIIMLDRALSGYEAMEQEKAFGMSWCLQQQYEKVYTNTQGAIWEIACFLGVNPTSEMVDQVIIDCSIEKMESVTRSRFLKFTHTMRHSLGGMAEMVKKILPKRFKGSWGLRKYHLKVLPKVDRYTCMALKHIEPTKGVPGAWKFILGSEEQRFITERYESYFKRAGYASVEVKNNL